MKVTARWIVVVIFSVVSVGSVGVPNQPLKLPQPFVRPQPPREVIIRGIRFKVFVENQIPDDQDPRVVGDICDEDGVKEGICAPQRLNTIHLRAGLFLEEERAVLVHEIEHGILGTKVSDDEVTYHEAIYKISPFIPDVMRDNPALVRYLTARGDLFK